MEKQVQPDIMGKQDPESTADFDKAYLKLVGKYAKENGGDLLVPGQDMYRYQTMKKFDPKQK
jgi:hypothetical protein